MQLGPITRSPELWAMSVICCWRSVPSASPSAKPEVMTTAPPTPRSAQSAMADGTYWAGTTTVTMSTVSGSSSTDV